MGVYIKGMEMPTSCVYCKFHKSIYCTLTDICTNAAKGCPLVPVPPHGRLIDASKCEGFFYEHMSDKMMEIAMIAIEEMPTIIPPEEGEHG